MSDFQYGTYAGYPQQLAPQGFFGGLIGSPLGGLIGRGIGGLAGNPNLGARIGQLAGGIGGSLLPFGVDPVALAYAQQQQAQLAPQGFFGDVFGQIAQPIGSAIGGLVGHPALGGQIGGIAGQLGRSFIPFNADPVAAAYAVQQAQQAQLAPQGFFGNLLGQIAQPVGTAVGGLLGHPALGGQLGGIAGQLGRTFLPFSADPVAYAQQQALLQQQLLQHQQALQQQQLLQHQQALQQQQLLQQQQALQQQQLLQQALQQRQASLAPQGFFGDVLGQIAQPIGSAVGGLFGNANLGGQIGGIAGQLGRNFIPFSADPVAAAYAQQQLLQQAQSYGLPPYIGASANSLNSQATVH
ncbi:hypothetical protein [Massilia sp. BJB1822]|uniref:hypothetical protein n=1 Tax=Massilia sp. BJB1822 TaxID=2744470 RepID=UPI001593BE39|nr:hypothetical protein [Massilia sp. BJB1822]NVE00177.1 hypothetical protein [Massilia sp. BJB1822]